MGQNLDDCKSVYVYVVIICLLEICLLEIWIICLLEICLLESDSTCASVYVVIYGCKSYLDDCK
jgi:hypothetical protein